MDGRVLLDACKRAAPGVGRRVPIVCVAMLNLCIAGLFLAPMRDRPLWDLAQFYLTGKLVRAGQISQVYHQPAYAPFVEDLRQQDERASRRSLYFNRPAVYAPLYLPLAFLSYRDASVLAVAVNLVLLGVVVWKLPRWFPAIPHCRVWLFLYLPFLYSVAYGQETILLTLGIGFGAYLAVVRRDIASGIVFALAALKPQLILLVPVALIAAHRWKSLVAFLATGTILLLLTFALVGAHGMREWLDFLRSPAIDVEMMGNIRAIGLHFGMPAAATAGAIALAAFSLVLWRGGFAQQLGAALSMSLLASPHTFLQDYSVLALVALLALPPAMQYVVLLPWLFFLPDFGQNILPVIFLNLACLLCMAVPLLRRPGLAAGKALNFLLPVASQDRPWS